MTKHFGDDYPEIEAILKKYVGNYYDEFLRVDLCKRKRTKREKYCGENPWLFSAIFCALLSDIDATSSLKYRKFFQNEIFPITEGAAFGTWSRQPYGKNTYPENHPEYDPDRNWNTISKDEVVGQVYLGSIAERMKLAYRALKNLPMDDFGKDDKRYRMPLTTRYYCMRGAKWKPTIAMSVMWNIDKFYDWAMINFFRWSPLKKRIADTVIKNFVRHKASVGARPKQKHLIWAVDLYFPEGHPFKLMVREI